MSRTILSNYYRIKKSPLMGPYATGTQLRVSKASKQYLYNAEEEEFLDCTNSAAHVGHCHPQVVNAAVSQMSRLATCQGFHSEPLDKYVRELLETFPPELSVCYLCNSGSEANDLALRMARQFTGNEDVVIHEGTYHGSLGVLVDVSPKLHGLMPGGAGYKKKDWVHVLPLPNAFNGKIDGAGLTPAEHMGAYVENARQRIRGGLAARKVPGAAALLVDPCFAVPGLYIPSKEYMEVHSCNPSCIHNFFNFFDSLSGPVQNSQVLRRPGHLRRGPGGSGQAGRLLLGL